MLVLATEISVRATEMLDRAVDSAVRALVGDCVDHVDKLIVPVKPFPLVSATVDPDPSVHRYSTNGVTPLLPS